MYVICPRCTLSGARELTYTCHGERPAARGPRNDIHEPEMTYTARRRRQQSTDRELPAGDRRPADHGPRAAGHGPRPADHVPRAQNHGSRAAARGPAHGKGGRPDRLGALELEGRRGSSLKGAGSHTDRPRRARGRAARARPADPERAKKRAGAWPALEGGLSRAGR